MSNYFSGLCSSSSHTALLNNAQSTIQSPAAALGSVQVIKFLLVGLLLASLGACEFLSKPKPADEAIVAPEPQPKKEPLPSAAPLERVSAIDARYAQKTLNSIGYSVGQIDGIWGPRSAKAIREFEQKFGLPTSNGFLSELNLFMLEKVSNSRRTQKPTAPVQPVNLSIAAKLDQSTPLADAPQLVFLDQTQQMLAKPNPFSEQLAELAPGTGIYVISKQEGWYEVESEDKQRGFIKAD